MRILSLDLARKVGWALGESDGPPRSDVKVLRTTDLDIEAGAAELGRFIRDLCFLASSRPEFIVFEAPMPIFNDGDSRGDRSIRRSPDSLAQPPMLAGAVLSLAACYGIECRKVFPATWRKHFLGKSNFGSPDATKRATVERCRVLGYIPRDAAIRNQKADPLFDRCDALGLWDYASETWGKKRPRELVMFGERAA